MDVLGSKPHPLLLWPLHGTKLSLPRFPYTNISSPSSAIPGRMHHHKHQSLLTPSFCNLVHLFDKMPLRDVVSWNTMMSGFVSSSLFPDAFAVFREMMLAGTCPTQSSFASVMVASAEMGGAQLRQVHTVCLKYGLASDSCVGNALLKGYVELGGVDDLRGVMGEMCGLDGISVEILLKGYTKHGVFGDAFKLFKTCSLIGVNFSPYAISSLISLCGNVRGGEGGAQVHGAAVKIKRYCDMEFIDQRFCL